MFKTFLGLVVSTLLVTSGCAAVNLNPMDWETPAPFASQKAPVGTPAWWKHKKSLAEFVPGEGYRVEGVEGYFDQEGRPIQTRVAKRVEEVENKGLLKNVNFAGTVTGLKTQVGMGPDEKQAQFAFAKGEDLFQREKYPEAAKQFKETISRWPDSSLAQDAQFLLGESQFFSHQYPDAVNTYDQLLKDNPNSKHLDKIIRREFDIAQYWEKHNRHEPHWTTTPNVVDATRPLFDTLGRSLRVYENIRLNDPTGPLADDSIMAIANSHFLRGRYNDADYHYELLRNEYPQSDHQFEAHLLGLQCKLQKYQGPDYDGTPLREANRLIRQIRTQFAGKLSSAQRDRLEIEAAALQKQMAMRDWSLAQFYEENGYNGSAKFYYAKVIRSFHGTPIANDAQQAYAALEGKPDHPEVQLESIVNLFPENAERQAIAQVPLLENSQPQSKTLIARPPGAPEQGETVVR